MSSFSHEPLEIILIIGSEEKHLFEINFFLSRQTLLLFLLNKITNIHFIT